MSRFVDKDGNARTHTVIIALTTTVGILIAFKVMLDRLEPSEYYDNETSKVFAHDLRMNYNTHTYTGKTIIVSGTIDFVNPLHAGHVAFSVNGLGGVHCEATSSQKHRFMALSKGDYVSIRGIVTSPAGAIPYLEQCRIVRIFK